MYRNSQNDRIAIHLFYISRENKKVAKEWKKKTYLDAAVRMLKALDEKSCSYDIKTDYLLERCTAAYGDEKHNFPIVYGDYYYIEALLRLRTVNKGG